MQKVHCLEDAAADFDPNTPLLASVILGETLFADVAAADLFLPFLTGAFPALIAETFGNEELSL